jgi:hypothetical protein
MLQITGTGKCCSASKTANPRAKPSTPVLGCSLLALPLDWINRAASRLSQRMLNRASASHRVTPSLHSHPFFAAPALFARRRLGEADPAHKQIARQKSRHGEK